MTNHPTSADAIDPLAECWIHYLENGPTGRDISVEVRLTELFLLTQNGELWECINAIRQEIANLTAHEYERRDKGKIESDSRPNCQSHLLKILAILNGRDGIIQRVESYRAQTRENLPKVA